MKRSLLPTLLLACTLGGVGGVATAAPAKKKTVVKKTVVKKTSKPKLVANPGQWHRYQGRMVKRIEITGLQRTRRWRFTHLLDTRVGRPLDAETLRHDIRRVRNLQLFRPLRVRVDPEGKGVVIRIQTRDKWSLLPYFNLFFNLGSVSAITGVYDVNTFGFLSFVDLQVMLFSYLPLTRTSIRPGFLLGIQAPRLGGLPFTYRLSARAQTTIRTLFTLTDEEFQILGSFQVDRYGGYHALTWEPYQWLRVGVQQTLLYHRYRIAPDTDAPTVPVPETGLTHAFALTGSLGYTRYRDYMQHGILLSFALEGSSTHLGSASDFVRFYGQARAYYDFGSRWGNLVARVGGGYMKGGTFSNLFSLGSWTGLRGFSTAQFTARSFLVGNLEYRTGLVRTGFPVASIFKGFRGKVFQIQGAVFADVGGVAGSGAYRTEEHGVPLVSVGAGLRLAIVNIYKAIMRIDFAYTLSPYRSFDLIVATQQYF